MPGLLQPVQHHDLHQAADMETVRRGVESGISSDRALGRVLIQRRGVGQLVNESSCGEDIEQV